MKAPPLKLDVGATGESRRRASGEAVSGRSQSHRHGQANLEERTAKGAGGCRIVMTDGFFRWRVFEKGCGVFLGMGEKNNKNELYIYTPDERSWVGFMNFENIGNRGVV